MICHHCRKQDHGFCRNEVKDVTDNGATLVDSDNTWCDCQHRPPAVPTSPNHIPNLCGLDARLYSTGVVTPEGFRPPLPSPIEVTVGVE